MSSYVKEMTELFFGNIIMSMREFQKNNNIKNQCLTNAQYLYDALTENKVKNDVKVQACFVISLDRDVYIVGGHVVVMLDNVVLDPSFDVHSLNNKTYFENVNDFMKALNKLKTDGVNINELKTDGIVGVKGVVSHHVQFVKYAEQMNRGVQVITERTFYDDQADHIERLYNRVC